MREKEIERIEVAAESEELKLISIAGLSALFGISVAALERRYMTQPDFPGPVRLSGMPHEPRRYLLKEIMGYMQSRLDARASVRE